MTILALDPHPTKPCGFAHSNGQVGLIDCGTYNRFGRLYAFIHDMHTRFPFQILAAEHAAMGSPNFTIQNQHAEVCGVLRLWRQQLGCEFVLVHPVAMKAWATGSGRATKAAMGMWAKRIYGRAFDNDDQCDAFWILKFVESGQHEKVAAEKAAKKEASRKNRQWWRGKAKKVGRLF